MKRRLWEYKSSPQRESLVENGSIPNEHIVCSVDRTPVVGFLKDIEELVRVLF